MSGSNEWTFRSARVWAVVWRLKKQGYYFSDLLPWAIRISTGMTLPKLTAKKRDELLTPSNVIQLPARRRRKEGTG